MSLRTGQERNETFLELLRSPVPHTDCTNARAGGKNAYVFVCATREGKAMYFARSKKGHKGVEGTVVQDYEGILVQDHEPTFYQYGRDHQECLAHVLRCLKDSIENEPERSWNKQMQAHIHKMIHYWNSLDAGEACTPEEIACLEEEYRRILEKAKEEYEYIPATEYYKKGYNLYLRLEKYMHNHFLFLYDPQVPSTNNEAERLLRSYKRKQQQTVSFRNIESIQYLCESMSMLIKIRQEYDNIFKEVSQIFE